MQKFLPPPAPFSVSLLLCAVMNFLSCTHVVVEGRATFLIEGEKKRQEEEEEISAGGGVRGEGTFVL